MTKAKFLVRVEVRDYLEATTVAIVKALQSIGFAEVKVYRLDKPADHVATEKQKAAYSRKMEKEGKRFMSSLDKIFGMVEKGEPSDASKDLDAEIYTEPETPP